MLSTIFEHSFHSGTGMDLPVLSEISKRAVANSVMIFRRVASFLALVSSSFRSSMYAFLSIPRRPRFSSMSRSFLSTASAFISPFSSFFTSFFFSTFFRSPLSLFFFVAPSAGPVFLSQKSLVIPPAPTSISTSDESLSLPLPSASSSSLQSEKSSPAGSPVFLSPTSPESSSAASSATVVAGAFAFSSTSSASESESSLSFSTTGAKLSNLSSPFFSRLSMSF
mmetsp:Transcript_7248/g.13508  ORF Transcript_7248/g.13508 Transcript_7248/m.13508 type:complete len:224 (+) Transcript_7248:1767-2438(+)